MTQANVDHRHAAPKPAVHGAERVRALAEAGAKGRVLSPREVRLICEALRARGHTVRNQFHSGH